jgi:hypothetical protein
MSTPPPLQTISSSPHHQQQQQQPSRRCDPTSIQFFHTIIILCQFATGASLVFEGAQWFVSAAGDDSQLILPALVLTLCGAIACALCIFHTGQIKQDAVIAGTIISSLWTLLAGISFLYGFDANLEGITLLVNSMTQLIGIVLLSQLPSVRNGRYGSRNDWSAEESIAMNDRSSSKHHYGALSNYVDRPEPTTAPMSAAATLVVSGTTTAANLLTPSSPKTSPQLSASSPPRTPSPFGPNTFSNTSRVVSSSPQRSAAAITSTSASGSAPPLPPPVTPHDTPETMRGHYKALLEKYALDS